MKKITIEIEGMSCMGCVGNVEKAMKEMNGVKDVKVSLENKNAIIETSDEVNPEDLELKIKGVGYNPIKVIQNEN